MKKTTLFILLLWFSASALVAQGLAASARQSGEGVVSVTLGQSVVALNGPWKFQIGDSPMDPKTHRPLWAEPSFDDSQWETVDLASPASQPGPLVGGQTSVKGWTTRGHAGYSGWAWYRLRIKVALPPGKRIAVDGPIADDAWQLFANDKILGSFGSFDQHGNVRRIYLFRPMMFLLPPFEPTQADIVTETFAFRVWMSSMELTTPDVGGLYAAPLLVAGSATPAQSRLDWTASILGRLDEFTYIAFFLLLSALAASLTLFDRSDRVYLWIAATFLVAPLGYLLLNLCWTVTWFDVRLTDVLISTDDALWATGWVIVWSVWFRLQRRVWAATAIALMAATFAATDALKHGLVDYEVVLPHGHHAALLSALGATNLAMRLAFVIVLALVIAEGIRKEGKEGWLALPAVALLAVEMVAEDFGVVRVGRFYGIPVRIWDVTDPLLVAILVFLMLRRLLHSLERQRQMALDVRQAQEVQQVILPHTITKVSGLMIESEYRPAREVGGDFFQIIPHKTDGSLLIVAGDVTGKGLKAGMLVALLVGAIQGVSETTAEPLEILAALNRRLLGRGDAQATCLALRIANDGSMTLANAGHVPPYLNAEPLQMEGALPLGIIGAAEFSQMRFRLAENDRLTLLSDGIVEATDANGNLFGFERIKEFLCRATSAAELATAAQKFGQQDDITVLSLTFAPVGVVNA